MKFQKGVLSGQQPRKKEPDPPERPATPTFGEVEKNRLFETQQEIAGSSSHYLKALAVLGVIVLIGGGVAFYLLQPGVGDVIKAPADMENAVREHFLTVEKRTATDIVTYKCDGFYWARVGVETRTDLPNPLLRIDKYSARITGESPAWQITALPVKDPGQSIPCS